MIVVDIETKDNGLIAGKGDGAVRKDGFITCVATFNGVESKCYHIDDPELKEILATKEDKCFHNANYDLSWLCIAYGLKVNGRIHDTLVRASLVEPTEESYKLDSCCLRMGVAGKNYEDTVEQWAKAHGIKGKAIQQMDLIPFDIQAKYAMQDCKATFDLWNKQQALIEERRLEGIDTLESDLIPVNLRMKKNGIRIDETLRAKMADDWQWRIIELEDDLTYEAGIVNVGSHSQIARFFHEDVGISSPILTEKGNESWDKDAMHAIDHPIAEKIIKLRALKQIYSTFLDGSMKDTYNGRLHATFHQTRRDEGGTITGRYSCSDPNLQNIPSRDTEISDAPLIRQCFIPNDDCVLIAFDYKQVEYRIFSHYAISLMVEGYLMVKEAMSKGIDYHKWVLNLLGWDDHMRKIAKNLNFGVLYGMGKGKMKKTYYKMFRAALIAQGIPVDGGTFVDWFKTATVWSNAAKTAVAKSVKKDCDPIDIFVDWVYYEYFNSLSFVKPTCKRIMNRANTAGKVVSIGGRHHVTEWGADYKSVNKLIQGSAADILKIGLVNAEKAGIWDVLTLHMTVHDENVASAPCSKIGVEATMELKRAMCNVSNKLTVPIDVDCEAGPNWYDVDDGKYQFYCGAWSVGREEV